MVSLFYLLGYFNLLAIFFKEFYFQKITLTKKIEMNTFIWDIINKLKNKRIISRTKKEI